MLSENTWPNPRCGSDKAAVHIIIEEYGFKDDVEYGKTKLFVRHPHTILAMEEARSRQLPEICITLQKMWRGTLARILCRKMSAVRTVEKAYCRYRQRCYLASLAQLFSPTALRKMKDYGKKVVWPSPPRTLVNFENQLKKAHRRWRAYMILKRIAPAERPALQLKIFAADALKGCRRDWGSGQEWKGNYLVLSEENPSVADANQSLSALKSAGHFTKVLFACLIKKTNRFCKTADRAICFTDKFIYKLEPKKKFKSMKTGIPISEITGISVTPGPDQLVIIHLQGGNDLVMCLMSTSGADRVGELIGTICSFWMSNFKRDLRVIVSKCLQTMLGSKQKSVSVERATGQPVFVKNSDGIILNWAKTGGGG